MCAGKVFLFMVSITFRSWFWARRAVRFCRRLVLWLGVEKVYLRVSFLSVRLWESRDGVWFRGFRVVWFSFTGRF